MGAHWRAMIWVIGLAPVLALAAQRIPVASEGGIRDRWQVADGVTLGAPAYPGEFAARGDEVCVAVGYLLNPDGHLSDFVLLKAWNSSTGASEPAPGYWRAFAGAAADALQGWRFKPRPEVARPQPVYTVGTFVFGMHGPPAVLRQRCAIPNLAARLRELRTAPEARNAGILDQLDLGAPTDAWKTGRDGR